MSRDSHLNAARVYLHQARAFRLRGSAFAFTLLEWAANARKRAGGLIEPEQVKRTGPIQGELFA